MDDRSLFQFAVMESWTVGSPHLGCDYVSLPEHITLIKHATVPLSFGGSSGHVCSIGLDGRDRESGGLIAWAQSTVRIGYPISTGANKRVIWRIQFQGIAKQEEK